jgi:Zn-dependent alcohol dehydrogenase
MPTLGATLEDLEALSTQLVTTTGDIGDVRDETRTAITEVVERLRQAGQAAVQTARQQMAALRTTVDSAQTRADGADWTGHNAEVFRSAYHDFSGAIGQAEQSTTDYFDEFNALLDRLGADTETYVGELGSSLTNAQTSTESMGHAVGAQRENLDQVMNTGFSVG